MSKLSSILLIFSILKLTTSHSIISKNVEIFATPPLNNEPIIGILSEEMSYYLASKFPNEYHSYIAASYVKFVEGGGARAVPIWWVPKIKCFVWRKKVFVLSPAWNISIDHSRAWKFEVKWKALLGVGRRKKIDVKLVLTSSHEIPIS